MYPVSHPLHVNLTERNTLKNRAPSQDTVVGRNSGSSFISQSNQSEVQPPVEASALGRKLPRSAIGAGLGQGSAAGNLEAAGPGVQATSVRQDLDGRFVSSGELERDGDKSRKVSSEGPPGLLEEEEDVGPDILPDMVGTVFTMEDGT